MIWLYVTGAVVMMLITLSTGFLDRPQDDDVSEWAKITLLLLVGITWPYQLMAILYFLLKRLLQ